MKKILRSSLCFLLSIVLIFSTFVAAVAAETDSQSTEPVVVINDIYANPIYNTNDGTVIFDLSKYDYDLLFTSGFSAEFANIITDDLINGIVNDELTVMDMANIMIDAFGYSEDINKIINTVIDLALELLGSADFANLDIAAILSSIDLQSYFGGMFDSIKSDIELLDYLEMNEDGTPAYAFTGALSYDESLEYYFAELDYDEAVAVAGSIGEIIADEIGYENTYVFTYDFRLDPAVNAEKLDAYINNVKSVTGSDKVSVISEGYGSVIATEYLAEYADNAAESVNNFVTVSSEFLGTSVMGDVFKGEIAEDSIFSVTNFTSAYIRYTNDISDNPITAFLMWLLNYIMNTEWEAQDYCMDIAEALNEGYNILDTAGVLEQLSYMPGLWALVPVEDFDAAVDNMFTDEINDDLYDAICNYKDNQDFAYDIIVDAKDSGINVSVIAAWDLQIMPIGQNVNVQSDGVVDTAYASFGATCVDLNDVADAMLAEQSYVDDHDHMSANYDMLTPWYQLGGVCYYVDASTCALPENTWFIKNMKHGTFDLESNSAELLVWLVCADSERTVWQDASFKQFITYNRYINPGVLLSDGFVSDSDATTGKYILGDVNLDGIITSLDSRLASRFADGIDKYDEGSIQFMNADVDADGEITDLDVQYILDMSTGINKQHSIAIKVDADDEESGMMCSESEIELLPVYNSATNQLEITVSVLNAVNTYAGNFVINYDEAMLTYNSAKYTESDSVYVSAGQPFGYGSVVTVAYSTSKAITAKQCDAEGNYVLTTLYFDVSRKNVTATTLSAGSTYFFDDSSLVYVTPIELMLDEDFFFMYGDADNNRYITAADARYVLRVAADLETITDELTFKRCDVNKDSVITAADARLILRASADLISSF